MMAREKVLSMKLKLSFCCVDCRAAFALLPDMNDDSGWDDD